jgi:hypothetical protein
VSGEELPPHTPGGAFPRHRSCPDLKVFSAIKVLCEEKFSCDLNLRIIYLSFELNLRKRKRNKKRKMKIYLKSRSPGDSLPPASGRSPPYMGWGRKNGGRSKVKRHIAFECVFERKFEGIFDGKFVKNN